MAMRITASAMDEEGLVRFIALMRRWAGWEEAIVDSSMLCSFLAAAYLASWFAAWAEPYFQATFHDLLVLYGLFTLLVGVVLYTFLSLPIVRPVLHSWIYHRVIAQDMPRLKFEVCERLREMAPDVYRYLNEVSGEDG